MIKNALEYIVGLGRPETVNINDREYSTEKLNPVLEPTASTLRVTTLDALIDYIKSKVDVDMVQPELIHVESPTSVKLYSPIYGDFQQRECYIAAEPLLPEIQFGRFMDSEKFIISMQSKFEKTDDLEAILKIVGNIKEEAVKNVGDDGISQAVTVKTGIAKVENVVVPNPAVLKPFRTFTEVEQPESKFIFRMQSGPEMALFEADGGAWRTQAMKNIKAYLEKELRGCEVNVIA